MRASLILRELGISFEELLEYGRILEMDLSDPKIDISEETFQQTKELASDQNTRQRIKEAGMRIKARNLGAYMEHDLYYKIPAEIKWFGDRSSGGDYGFLNLPDLGDVYFNINHVAGLSYGELRPEVCVMAEIPKADFEVKHKKSASKIYPLQNEEDIRFMLFCFLIYQDSALKNLSNADLLSSFRDNLIRLKPEITQEDKAFFIDSILVKLEDRSLQSEAVSDLESLFLLLGEFTPEDKKKNEIDQITRAYLFNRKYQFILYRFVLSLRVYCKLEISEEIEKRIMAVSYENHFYNWWLDYDFKIPFSSLQPELIKRISDELTDKHKFLSKLKSPEIEILFQDAFQRFVGSKEIEIDEIARFLDLAKEYDQKLEIEKLGEKKHFLLWKMGKTETAPLSYIRAELIKPEEKNADKYYGFGIDKEQTKVKADILRKMSVQNLKDLISLIYLEEDRKQEDQQFKEVLFILENIEIAAEEKSQLSKIAFNNSSDWHKLKLFVADITDIIDYDNTIIYTGLLDSESQKLFFKKTLKLIEEKKLNLELEDLNRINTIDFETSEYAKEIDGVGLDFSLAVIIQLVNDLKQKEITKSRTIYELVANQIKRPDDLLVIDGFFDKCNGRTILKSDQDSDEYRLHTTLERSPRFSTFCDGRKAIDKATGKPSKCNQSGREFWWCENDKCFEIARKKHTSREWRDYNLEDVLRILKIDYSESQYEILLGVINRVNRYLKHMTCRACNKILKPVDKGNYGFYRVSNFKCPDASCEKHHEEIYLSHCANGYCEDIIDSRDSVKCKPDGFHENCGWYICKNCYACCSTEKLKGRQYVYNMTGQQYHCHTEGHKDRGVLCCNKCGNEMKGHEQNGKLYERQLKWFKEQKDINRNIVKYGKRNDGKWWFIWDQGGFSFEEFRKHITNLYQSGFNIPDFHDEGRTSQLIAEPFNEMKASKVFSCSDCGNMIKIDDLSEFDYARQNSIKNYHDRIFSKTKVK